MEHIGYALIVIAAIIWFGLMLSRIVQVFPEGIIGLVAIIGIGVLFVKVLSERLSNREDNHYSETVEK